MLVFSYICSAVSIDCYYVVESWYWFEGQFMAQLIL
jgi:hypothetical protein